MKNINRFLAITILLVVLATNPLFALKYKHHKGDGNSKSNKAGTCLPATNSNELDINNVRAYIETNGTMWFREIARYEIPKGSGKTSMFASALWVGGYDVSHQLKLAAVRFRQDGDDFWTGPLSVDGNASVTQDVCSSYDRFWKITRAQVEEHIARWDDPTYVMPTVIRDWKAHGETAAPYYQSQFLMPFNDLNGNEQYDPEEGEYPYYDFNNELCPWTPENLFKDPVRPYETTVGTVLPTDTSHRKTIGGLMVDHILKGDQTLYWIFNDKGGPHTESKGTPIGLEIRGQAFAFATNDEINNMTFYSYEIINRSTYELTETFFSQWVDPDLGYANDDYVGCDVMRGLGYCYNGREVDGTGMVQHYGTQPPAVGVDFFQGPYMDDDFDVNGEPYDNPRFYRDSASTAYCDKFLNPPVPHYDIYGNIVNQNQMAINGVNFGDSIPNNERFGMRRFVYYNNASGNNGEPEVATDYYNYLIGQWKDGSKMKFGGNAYNVGAVGPECDFMFPGTTDICNWGTKGVVPTISNWTDQTAGNAPADRRFMQSAGPFTLKSGAVNYITVGIPWARASQGGAWASVELLKVVDDKCQALFENCFKVIDGPDAPDLAIRELNQELILYIRSDDPTSNNYNEQYIEMDNTIPEGRVDQNTAIVRDSIFDGTNWVFFDRAVTSHDTITYDRHYRFEGYIIYQLKNKDVGVSDLSNPDKAQIVGQCDIKNFKPNGDPVGKLVNWEYNQNVAAPVATEKVNGANTGIYHSLQLTEDMFAIGDKRLVNHKKYYYMAIAYAYNEYATYSVDPTIPHGLEGQKTVFLAGRKNIKTYEAVPHNTLVSDTMANSVYGTQPMITRIEGQGNGGNFLEMTQATHDKIMSGAPWKSEEIEYMKNAGPLGIKVIDPLKIQAHDYVIKLLDEYEDITDTARWILEADDMPSIHSDMSIGVLNEQLVLSQGLSIQIFNSNFWISDEAMVYDSLAYFYGRPSFQSQAKYAQVSFVGSSISFADESKKWLTGIPDIDGESAFNWIRSGQQSLGQWDPLGDDPGVVGTYSKKRLEDYLMLIPRSFAGIPNINYKTGDTARQTVRSWKDPNSSFEGVVNGTWAPYVLASCYDGGPQANYVTPEDLSTTARPIIFYHDFTNLEASVNSNLNTNFNQTMINLYSVDIVMTSDKSKWSRAIVLEASENKTAAGAWRHEPKKSASVDKNGNPDGTGTGMGWFPGYAINVETGERLNIMFSENSDDPANNGDDMLFNPTSVSYDPNTGQIVWGGKHYVYVCGSTGNTSIGFYARTSSGINSKRDYNSTIDCPAYDECQWLMNKFNTFVNIAASTTSDHPIARKRAKMQLFNNVMWTSIPMADSRYNWLDNEVKIKIRVTRPYLRWSSYKGAGVAYAQNDNYPMYKFTTRDIAVTTNILKEDESILDLINVVPNPYYGYATYESAPLENIVKIVNLPENCNISIYTVSGILVRKITKGDSKTTSVDWDLKNNAGIPISGGVYIIHVQVPDIGERTLKFFGAMRPTDVNAF